MHINQLSKWSGMKKYIVSELTVKDRLGTTTSPLGVMTGTSSSFIISWVSITFPENKDNHNFKMHTSILIKASLEVFLLISTLGTCAIALKRHLMCSIDNLYIPATTIFQSTWFLNKSVNYTFPSQMSRNPLWVWHFGHPCCINRSRSFLCATLVQSSKWQESSNSIFSILIYEFNIYLFFKRRGKQLLEKGACWKKYGR